MAGEWRNIYELLSFDRIAYAHEERSQYWHESYDPNAIAQQQIGRFVDEIKMYLEKGCWDDHF